jgi:mannosyltransferase OCH1-like enzyme
MFQNIPKILHLYWGNNEKLSYLHYLTVRSFRKYNPDWVIKIYHPVKTFYENTWVEKLQDKKYNGRDYNSKVDKLNVIRVPVDFDTLGFKNYRSEVLKSDFFRYYILHKEGGVWSDYDVLYIKPMKDIVIPNPEVYGDSKNINTCFSYFKNHYSIGFLMSTPGNIFFKKLMDNCCNFYDKKHYECLGISMWHKLYATPTDIIKSLPSINLLLLPEPFYLPYDYNNMDLIFHKTDTTKIKLYTVGIHWFYGHMVSRKFVNEYPNGNFSLKG